MPKFEILHFLFGYWRIYCVPISKLFQKLSQVKFRTFRNLESKLAEARQIDLVEIIFEIKRTNHCNPVTNHYTRKEICFFHDCNVIQLIMQSLFGYLNENSISIDFHPDADLHANLIP